MTIRQDQILQKLEWPVLLDHLGANAQTDDGRERCLTLRPNLGRDTIEERWRLVEPLRLLASQGYHPPIGEIPPLPRVIRALELGQLLAGLELRAIFDLLDAVKRVLKFCGDLSSRCSTLKRFQAQLYPLPRLADAINKAIGADGELLDTASPELMRIRSHKLSMRKKIEEQIRKLLRQQEVEQYLQDDFFTIRADRYVVPMRLDGRGRVQGKIYDTSDSGQTLFIEPAEIAPANEQLLELELAEKLEILRIFRDLSAQGAAEVDIIRVDYEELINLDFLTAQARLAAVMLAGQVKLSDEPVIDLRGARHPLIQLASGSKVIPNDIELTPTQNCLVISGPNAGGKTVVLKTVGLLHLMAKAGLLLPADAESQLYLFEDIFLEMGDAQNLSASLSTFSGHVVGLKPIVESAGSEHLVLLDELAVGTEPQTGSAIAQAILETLSKRGCRTLATTHFDGLKGLALTDSKFRNGSMEYSLSNFKPTYQLIMDVPGQSYGLEVAEQMGLPSAIVDRARQLRGHHVSALDQAVNQLMIEREHLREIKQEISREKLNAQTSKAKWDEEYELLRETRQKLTKNLRQQYEEELSTLRLSFDEALKEMRKAAKAELGTPMQASFTAQKQKTEEALKAMEQRVNSLGAATTAELPGKSGDREDFREGMVVYVLPLRNEGRITKASSSSEEPIEVQVGVVKLRVSPHDLRILDESKEPSKKALSQPPPTAGKSRSREDTSIGIVLQNPVNSIDLRGRDAEDAIKEAFGFIDRALLRGEHSIILIHGHGEGRLKAALRKSLREDCPYDLRFRAGEEPEGGDGVTIVSLK